MPALPTRPQQVREPHSAAATGASPTCGNLSVVTPSTVCGRPGVGGRVSGWVGCSSTGSAGSVAGWAAGSAGAGASGTISAGAGSGAAAGGGVSSASAGPAAGGGGVELGRIARDEDQLEPLLCQRPREGQAHSVGSPGDQRPGTVFFRKAHSIHPLADDLPLLAISLDSLASLTYSRNSEYVKVNRT